MKNFRWKLRDLSDKRLTTVQEWIFDRDKPAV